MPLRPRLTAPPLPSDFPSILANAANKELARQYYRTETVIGRPDHLTEGVAGSIVGIAATVRISKQRVAV